MKTKHFIVQQDSDIRTVREHFAELYPYLRINFFRNKNNSHAITSQSIVFSDSVKLNEINPGFSGGTIGVSDDMSILEFENEFLRQFGLSVQLSRKSGNLWLDTVKTNQWTVKEQNDHGEAISPVAGHSPPFREVPYGC
jgi:hypothetical protein